MGKMSKERLYSLRSGTLMSGLTFASMALFVFCVSFISFEVLHPVADMLHTHSHICGETGNPLEQHMHGTDDPTTSHGPIVHIYPTPVVPDVIIVMQIELCSSTLASCWLNTPSPVPIFS